MFNGAKVIRRTVRGRSGAVVSRAGRRGDWAVGCSSTSGQSDRGPYLSGEDVL